MTQMKSMESWFLLRVPHTQSHSMRSGKGKVKEKELLDSDMPVRKK